MMPTIEAGAHFSGSAGVWVRTEECKGSNAPMRALSVWVDEKNAWFVADENVRRVEQLLLDHFPEYMHVGGKKDGFIVNRLGVVSVQERLL